MPPLSYCQGTRLRTALVLGALLSWYLRDLVLWLWDLHVLLSRGFQGFFTASLQAVVPWLCGSRST